MFTGGGVGTIGYGVDEDDAGGGEMTHLLPQSEQSVPDAQHGLPPHVCSFPGPPSSHHPLLAYSQLLVHTSSPAAAQSAANSGAPRTRGCGRGGVLLALSSKNHQFL